MSDKPTRVRRALLSAWDKAGLDVLAKGLTEHEAVIVSTGSTAATLRDAGVAVTEVSETTGFPEIMDGRVKTLHPAVHAGILADRGNNAHLTALVEHGIAPIDLVAVNLYPFRQQVVEADQPVDMAQAIELIDIGGPAMLRAAAKNHAHVTVLVDPADYAPVLAEIHDAGGVRAETRRRLAAKAFAATAAYDADVANWFAGGEPFPEQLNLTYARTLALRYGENPHQGAAFYVPRGAPWGLGSARVVQGKPLSYNNLLDADAAWRAAVDFSAPCVVIVKHGNPAGLAVAATPGAAYPLALAGDPLSAFGGVVAVNRPLDAATAAQIVEVFTEVVLAPAVDPEALAVLAAKPNLRVLEIGGGAPPAHQVVLRSVTGGLLAGDADTAPEDEGAWTVPTRAQPDAETRGELAFAWRVAKHTTSNAIVLTRGGAAVGVGAGQMSRVDSVRLAVEKSGGRSAGAVLASDAFFPFRDGVDAALDAGVRALVSPGGSVRDAEVVAACDERGASMTFTHRRHFRH